MSRTRLVRRAGVAAALASLVLSGAAGADPGLPKRSGPEPPQPDQWIVELDDAPAVRSAAARRGAAKFDSRTPEVRAYVSHLARREAAVLNAVPGVKVDVRYRHAFAGFAAHLSTEQVAALRGAPGVRRVVRERLLQVSGGVAAGGLAGSEAALLGLPGGLWQRLGGAADAGRGVIVGVIDTGITPEAEAFADHGLTPPAIWNGACEAGERFAASSCNDKLIGARAFLDGWRDENGSIPPNAYDSPRDDDGHGTHVASIATGRSGIDPSIGGNALGVGAITGVAPAAHVAAYKACIYYGCSDVDITAAIDRAVADGVDVLNLSLGGPVNPDAPVDPMQTALLNADAAGIFVATAAGNSGDAPDALGSPAVAPWTTAVAATTASRTFRSTVRAVGPRGREVVAEASSVAPALRRAPLVDARSFGVWPDACFFTEELTPERVRGKVVICDAVAPLDILDNALTDAGASGLLLVVSDRGEEPAARAKVPTFFVKASDGAALRELVRTGPTTVAATRATARPWQADRVAWFSSRGSAFDDLLRPDVAAPGVSTLAALAPVTAWTDCCRVPEDRFGVLSGTSMAAPHVAGVAALLTQLRPTWSSAAIRSALVTSAKPAVASDGSGAAPLLAGGAGRMDPQAAADPGLIVEPTTAQYEAFAESLDPDAIEGDLEPIAGRDLNLPSLAVERATDVVKLERTVTSVDSARGRWQATLEGWEFGELEGDVSPAEFTIAPGQRQTLRLQLVPYGGSRDFRNAAVLLENERTGRTVRLPLTVRNPGVIAGPPRLRIAAPAAEGAQTLAMTIAGAVEGQALGLARPQVREDELADDASAPGYGKVLPLRVPAGTALLSLRAAVPDGVRGSVALFRDVDRDGIINTLHDELAAEPDRTDPLHAEVRSPAPGDYLIDVYGTASQPFRFDLRTWRVTDPRPDDPGPAPGLVVAGGPQFAFPAAEQPFEVRWNGVDGTEELRGVIEWRNPEAPEGAPALATTVVELTPPAAER